MERLKEIEERLSAIKLELDNDGVDLDVLESEINSLTEERKTINEKVEKRQNLIKEVNETAPVIKTFEERKEDKMEVRTHDEIIASPEYRSAFLKRLQGKELNDVEKRSVAATNVSGAIPTQTSEYIFTKMREYAPMLGEIMLLNVAGNVSIAVEGTNNAAALHTENAELTAQENTTVTVSLGGYEIAKLVRISKTVQTMTINAFEGWLGDIIAENIANKIEDYVINGTGSSQPKGVDYARTWTDGSTAVDFAAATPTYAEMCELISYLPGGYYRNAKYLMNHSTFWTSVQAIRDDAKAPIVSESGGKYLIMGKEVLFSDKCNDGDIFLGDFKKVVGNLAQNIEVASSAESGFIYNAIDFRGSAIFDCDIAIAEAFVKGAADLTAGA